MPFKKICVPREAILKRYSCGDTCCPCVKVSKCVVMDEEIILCEKTPCFKPLKRCKMREVCVPDRRYESCCCSGCVKGIHPNPIYAPICTECGLKRVRVDGDRIDQYVTETPPCFEYDTDANPWIGYKSNETRQRPWLTWF